jgi:hypothetical protein
LIPNNLTVALFAILTECHLLARCFDSVRQPAKLGEPIKLGPALQPKCRRRPKSRHQKSLPRFRIGHVNGCESFSIRRGNYCVTSGDISEHRPNRGPCSRFGDGGTSCGIGCGVA